MKSITVFFVSLTLFFTIGCNYDYGKYGKDKKRQKYRTNTIG
jgi:hypothetical protein